MAGAAGAVLGCASRSTASPVRSNFEVHRVCGVGYESSMDIFVADVQGLLISNQRVSIVSAVAGTDFGGETDASGRIRKPVPAGRYEVVVPTDRGWAGARQSVAVDAGCAVAVDVALEPAITADQGLRTDQAPRTKDEGPDLLDDSDLRHQIDKR